MDAGAHLRPREAANVLWATARMGCAPRAPPITSLLHLAWSHLDAMKPQELSSTLYACALLGARPPVPVQWQALQRLGAVIEECEPQGTLVVIL